jgi:hypothetical protein
MNHTITIDYLQDRVAAAESRARFFEHRRAAHARCVRRGVLRRCVEPSIPRCC